MEQVKKSEKPSEIKASTAFKVSNGTGLILKTLFVLMTVLLQKKPQDDPVYQFLDKKRAESKPYYVYMIAGCNKFLRLYCGRIKEHLNATGEPVDWESTPLTK